MLRSFSCRQAPEGCSCLKTGIAAIALCGLGMLCSFLLRRNAFNRGGCFDRAILLLQLRGNLLAGSTAALCCQQGFLAGLNTRIHFQNTRSQTSPFHEVCMWYLISEKCGEQWANHTRRSASEALPQSPCTAVANSNTDSWQQPIEGHVLYFEDILCRSLPITRHGKAEVRGLCLPFTLRVMAPDYTLAQLPRRCNDYLVQGAAS